MCAEWAQDTPLVSVIVTAYNVEDYLREALDSILRQTLGVEDGSTDGTAVVVEEYASQEGSGWAPGAGRILGRPRPDVLAFAGGVLMKSERDGSVVCSRKLSG